MFIAMNRFQINAGREGEFEEVWAARESHLDEVPGFQDFKLLRGATGGATADGVTTYLSHSRWESREAFEAWTRSEAFRKAHAHAGSARGVVAGHPVVEGYEVVLSARLPAGEASTGR